jgi:hypothetical protein
MFSMETKGKPAVTSSFGGGPVTALLHNGLQIHGVESVWG